MARASTLTQVMIAALFMYGCNEAEVVWVEPPQANEQCVDASSAYFDVNQDGDLYLVCYWACAYPPEQSTVSEPSQVWLWIRWSDGHMVWVTSSGCTL